jgi:UDP-N-acetylmuramyl pentapeptide phosphotransferase/UDP-N-acetylglucosamine-1-phosphate transferase
VRAVTVAAVAAFAIAVLLTPLARSIGRRLRTLDVPNERSSHTVPTPRTGGWAILLGVLVGLGTSGALLDAGVAALAAGAVAVALLSFADELWTLPRSLRLGAQFVIPVVVFAATPPDVRGILLPVGDAPGLLAVALLVAVVWVVWITNAYNFMDGINGIASVEAIVCGSTFAALFLRQGDVAGALAAAVIAGAAAGFVPWNLPSGSIFMGDVGSAPLGFGLAVLALRLASTGMVVQAVLPLLPFILDATTTLLMRMAKGERFFSMPHRSHFYQRLTQQGFSHTAVTSIWGVLAVASSALALVYHTLSVAARLAGVLGVVAVHVALGLVILARGSSGLRVAGSR